MSYLKNFPLSLPSCRTLYCFYFPMFALSTMYLLPYAPLHYMSSPLCVLSTLCLLCVSFTVCRNVCQVIISDSMRHFYILYTCFLQCRPLLYFLLFDNDSMIHRLNLERLNLEWVFYPNGLNPEWD